jgi:hypothetical protein
MKINYSIDDSIYGQKINLGAIHKFLHPEYFDPSGNLKYVGANRSGT